MRQWVLAMAGVTAFAAGAAAETSTAKQALLVEHPGGRVLLAKAAAQAMAPSSMTKLMTLYLAFEAIEQKRAVEAAAVKVSKRAAEVRGATIGLAEGDMVPLGHLIRATIVASANDAATAIAEHLAGTEADFAKRMTDKARELGLAGSAFANATGHAAKDHRMSAADVAKLAGLLIQRFPDRYRLFAEREMSFRGKTFRNRNPVLGEIAGADGIKTGQTAAGGFGLVASALRDGRRLILVINGLPNEKARADEARRLLDWGFKQPAR